MKPNITLPMGRLRPAVPSDLDGLVLLLHNAEVRRYLCDDEVLPREQVAEILQRGLDLDSQHLGLWIIENAALEFCGVVGLQPVSEDLADVPEMTGGVEPVIAVHPRFSGTGLATMALAAAIDHARASVKLPGLVAAVDRPNASSHRLLLRCGFEVTGSAEGPANELVLYALHLREPAH
ncbi:MAG: GNAT family N-acetyltransferase [Pseudomonadota bacterium]